MFVSAKEGFEVVIDHADASAADIDPIRLPFISIRLHLLSPGSVSGPEAQEPVQSTVGKARPNKSLIAFIMPPTYFQ